MICDFIEKKFENNLEEKEKVSIFAPALREKHTMKEKI